MLQKVVELLKRLVVQRHLSLLGPSRMIDRHAHFQVTAELCLELLGVGVFRVDFSATRRPICRLLPLCQSFSLPNGHGLGDDFPGESLGIFPANQSARVS